MQDTQGSWGGELALWLILRWEEVVEVYIVGVIYRRGGEMWVGVERQEREQ